MRKLKSLFILLAITLVVSMTMNSCMITKTSVGQYTETRGEEYTYAKGKQLWLFWGIVPLGRTNVNTPGNGNCQVVTKYNFGDFLITGLTGGIVSSYSIKVKAKK